MHGRRDSRAPISKTLIAGTRPAPMPSCSAGRGRRALNADQRRRFDSFLGSSHATNHGGTPPPFGPSVVVAEGPEPYPGGNLARRDSSAGRATE